MATYNQRPIKPERKSKTLRNWVKNMFQMTLNKHAKFHGDRTIGDAITGKKASKHSISKVNDLKSMQYYSLDSLDH